MQKISKQLKTFIDHRRKGESLWLKKFKKKTPVIKFKEKWVLGLTEVKIWKLVSKNKKEHRQEKKVSVIYWERVTSSVSEMHLHVPVETQHARKVDLNYTCLFCSHGNGTVCLRTGPISGLLFCTTRILDLFWTSSLDFFHTSVWMQPLSLPAIWNRPERTSMQSH